jgi:hypothetical protein
MGMEYLPFPVTAPSCLSNAAITFPKGKSLLGWEIRNQIEALPYILKFGIGVNLRIPWSGFRATRKLLKGLI